MTTISPTLIAARYPLCLADDTLMNDDQLIRYIKQRCGEEVADAITDLIYANSIRAHLTDLVARIGADLSGAKDELDDISSVLDGMRELVNPE